MSVLKQVKKLWSSPHPPKGSDGCKDCEKLALLFTIEDKLIAQDNQLVNECADKPQIWWPAYSRIRDRKWLWCTALSRFYNDDDLTFDEDGTAAAWAD